MITDKNSNSENNYDFNNDNNNYFFNISNKNNNNNNNNNQVIFGTVVTPTSGKDKSFIFAVERWISTSCKIPQERPIVVELLNCMNNIMLYRMPELNFCYSIKLHEVSSVIFLFFYFFLPFF